MKYKTLDIQIGKPGGARKVFKWLGWGEERGGYFGFRDGMGLHKPEGQKAQAGESSKKPQ